MKYQGGGKKWRRRLVEDEYRRQLELKQTNLTKPLEFKCHVCGKEACYGFGVRLLAGIEGKWACPLHCNEVKSLVDNSKTPKLT